MDYNQAYLYMLFVRLIAQNDPLTICNKFGYNSWHFLQFNKLTWLHFL